MTQFKHWEEQEAQKTVHSPLWRMFKQSFKRHQKDFIILQVFPINIHEDFAAFEGQSHRKLPWQKYWEKDYCLCKCFLARRLLVHLVFDCRVLMYLRSKCWSTHVESTNHLPTAEPSPPFSTGSFSWSFGGLRRLAAWCEVVHLLCELIASREMWCQALAVVFCFKRFFLIVVGN